MDIDFRLHFSHAVNSLFLTFPGLVNGVVAAARLSRRVDVVELLREYDSQQHALEPEDRDCMFALLLLLQLLPSTNTRQKARLSSIELERAVITFKPKLTSISVFLSEKNSSQTQPFLFCVGTKETSGEFYLILDRKAVPLEDCGVLRAVDALFKAHYVFWVGYGKPIAVYGVLAKNSV